MQDGVYKLSGNPRLRAGSLPWLDAREHFPPGPSTAKELFDWVPHAWKDQRGDEPIVCHQTVIMLDRPICALELPVRSVVEVSHVLVGGAHEC
jgi:hypothetical protein